MGAKDTARLSEGHEISIPQAVLQRQGWKAGQTFAFIPKGDGVLLVRVPEIEELAGIVPGADTTDYRNRSDQG